MALLLLGVRIFLAAVFVGAALGKLADLAGLRRSLLDFGAPRQTVGVLGVLVPASEVSAAALLVPALTAWWGAALGLSLLAVFTLAVAVNLSKGRAPDCRCFGQVSATPIGRSTVVRNVVLASTAMLLLVVGPGATLGAAFDRWAGAPTGERLVWLGAIGLVALIVATLGARTQQALQASVPVAPAAPPEWHLDGARGLPVGTLAPTFDLPVLTGDHASIETLTKAGAPVVLIFAGTPCAACVGLWPNIERWQHDHGAALRIAVVGVGRPQAIEGKLMGIDLQDVLLAGDSRLLEAYQVAGLPSAVIVGPDGMVDSETVMGPVAIGELVNRAGGNRPYIG